MRNPAHYARPIRTYPNSIGATGIAKTVKIWSNKEMSSSIEFTPTNPPAPSDGVGSLQRLVREQQETIEKMERQMKQQQERIEQLEAELRDLKKLKGKPKIKASRLNTAKPDSEGEGKRPGSAKVSKKLNFEIDEERII